jgi:hypothetical protein
MLHDATVPSLWSNYLDWDSEHFLAKVNERETIR